MHISIRLINQILLRKYGDKIIELQAGNTDCSFINGHVPSSIHSWICSVESLILRHNLPCWCRTARMPPCHYWLTKLPYRWPFVNPLLILYQITIISLEFGTIITNYEAKSPNHKTKIQCIPPWRSSEVELTCSILKIAPDHSKYEIWLQSWRFDLTGALEVTRYTCHVYDEGTWRNDKAGSSGTRCQEAHFYYVAQVNTQFFIRIRIAFVLQASNITGTIWNWFA